MTMKARDITDEMLMDYLDGELTSTQITIVEEALSSDVNIKKRLHELQTIDKFLSDTVEETSDTFTEEVWNKLHPGTAQIPEYNIKRILLLMIAIFVVIIGSLSVSDVIWQIDFNWSFDKLAGYLPTEKIDATKGISFRLFTQGCLFAIVILSLLLLDKAVLRPYFIRRRAGMNV